MFFRCVLLVVFLTLPATSRSQAARVSIKDARDLLVIMPVGLDGKSPVFEVGIDRLLGPTGLRYAVTGAPFLRGDTLMTMENACNGYSSKEYADMAGLPWIGPMLRLRMAVFHRPDLNRPVSKLGDLQGYRVGVMTESYAERRGREAGLTMDRVVSDDLNLAKLAHGRIDYWLSYRESVRGLANLHNTSVPAEAGALGLLDLGLACNPSLPDATAARLRKSVAKYFKERGKAALDFQ